MILNDKPINLFAGCGYYVINNASTRIIDDDLLQLLNENLNFYNEIYKNESHPPIEYYKDKINVNIINNNININIGNTPPKKPWNKFLDIIITIIKLVTLILSVYSLGDNNDDSSNTNLSLQLT